LSPKRRKTSATAPTAVRVLVAVLCLLLLVVVVAGAGSFLLIMATRDHGHPPTGGGSPPREVPPGAASASAFDGGGEDYTTNEHDRHEADKLKARLAERNAEQRQQRRHRHPPAGDKTATAREVPQVQLASGRYKYVQVRAVDARTGEERYFVTSRRGARYHRDAAEPLLAQLDAAGLYRDVEVTGGGRIVLDDRSKKISIFGYSYTFGRPDHGISMSVVKQDPKYRDYHIDVSDEGY